jgi:choline dehydrogenase-like flavoprotein
MSEIVGVTEAIVEAFGGVPVSPGGAVGLTESPLGGVAHHTGTMRMGELADPVTVVDTDLRVRGHANLYVCDLSVFPTSPASNPSLTLTALALRLADTLVD